jgi:hypothetical protein
MVNLPDKVLKNRCIERVCVFSGRWVVLREKQINHTHLNTETVYFLSIHGFLLMVVSVEPEDIKYTVFLGRWEGKD